MRLRLSPDEFWDLSWFELSLYQLRNEEDSLRERDKEEGEWHRFRIHWAQFHNANFKEKVKPIDLIKLSFDKEEEAKKIIPLTPDEVIKKFGAKGKK